VRAPYAINARFVTQPLTGVQRYCYEVCQSLELGALVSPGAALPTYEKIGSRVYIAGDRLGGHPWEQLALPYWVGRDQPLLSPAGCGPVFHRNHVVVIHDVAVLEHPQWYSRSYAAWYRRLLPALSKRARTIVTVSQFCKGRIVAVLGVPEGKVVVAAEAAGAQFFPRSGGEVSQAGERLGVQRPYFLAIGAVSPRKNFKRLLAAWARSGLGSEGSSLVVVGKEGLRFSGGASLDDLPSWVQHLGAVSDEDLASLYSGAAGLVFPSLYEGFGLPILEAMASGCPVLTSNCTAMPEVAGDAAVLVDPLSEESIANGILQLMQPGRAADLRNRGLRRCRQFSWTRTAAIAEGAILN
jgi:glycosyltransferase involved in cell wall biosynthesis